MSWERRELWWKSIHMDAYRIVRTPRYIPFCIGRTWLFSILEVFQQLSLLTLTTSTRLFSRKLVRSTRQATPGRFELCTSG